MTFHERVAEQVRAILDNAREKILNDPELTRKIFDDPNLTAVEQVSMIEDVTLGLIRGDENDLNEQTDQPESDTSSKE